MEQHPHQETAEELSLGAIWRESTIWRNLERDLEDFPLIVDRYHADPCPETFAPLQKRHEGNRRNVAEAEKQRGNLKQMTLNLTLTVENLRQKAVAAQAAGDSEKVDKMRQE